MTIPSASNYPDDFDSDNNLYVVHDSLRAKLAEDYAPGDTSISIFGDDQIIAKFPPSGIITLTEQCSDIDQRAISFHYSSKTATTFDQLELLPEFEDLAKAKNITNVTLNVSAPLHNNLKNSIIEIEKFVGVKGTTDLNPQGETLEGRLNFLSKLVFTPRAWFSANKTIGLIPLEVTFKNESFRLGDGDIEYIWHFGDGGDMSVSVSVSTLSVTENVPLDSEGYYVQDLDGNTITKVFEDPGNYDISLTVRNEFGEDTVVFSKMINARIPAPNEAVIDFVGRTGQIITPGDPSGGPFTTPPKIRSSVGTFVDLSITSGENLSTPNRSYAGELLDSSDTPIDPIVTYTWTLSDDLTHVNSSSARAIYSIGGIYDLVLRVDTEFGSYRITNYENAIDIIESRNLWLWTFDGPTSVKTNEFGLISETFKTASIGLTIARDDSFLDSTNNEDQAKQEFARNVGFSPRGTTNSGNRGTSLLFWASGGTPSTSLVDQEVNVVEFEGFRDDVLTYTTHTSLNRPWNWAFLASNSTAYFALGQDSSVVPNSNPSYQVKTAYNLGTLTSSNGALTASNYKNGAGELMEHVSTYTAGVPDNGYFAVYRTAWKDQTGFIARNDGVGDFFRIKSFYKTEGTLSEPFQNITKITDIAGSAKLEGQLVALSNGIFFFNNSGNISAFNDSTSTWETGGPSANSVSFRSLQDTSVSDFDNPSNTLLATSDGDRTAYLSFDYSNSAFVKFNATDTTFSSLINRPIGEQWIMGVY